MAENVVVVDPRATRELRRDVLRPGDSLDQAVMEDDGDGVIALAMSDEGGALVACCHLVPSDLPEPLRQLGATDPSWRLRGMAVREDRRNRGVGALLLEATLEKVGAIGGGTLWCHARAAAASLYLRGGLEVAGEPFDEPGIGTHYLMWRRVPPLLRLE